MRGYGLSIDLNPSPVSPSLRVVDPPFPTRGEGKKEETTKYAPSQRSLSPLFHSRRRVFRFPDPEFALWRVLDSGAAGSARWRRDRRLRTRSLGARTGLPA